MNWVFRRKNKPWTQKQLFDAMVKELDKIKYPYRRYDVEMYVASLSIAMFHKARRRIQYATEDFVHEMSVDRTDQIVNAANVSFFFKYRI